MRLKNLLGVYICNLSIVLLLHDLHPSKKLITFMNINDNKAEKLGAIMLYVFFAAIVFLIVECTSK